MEDEICEVCGWYKHSEFIECTSSLGRAATALQDDVPEILSTKLGYGHCRLTFEIAKNFHIGLNVQHPWNKDGARDLTKIKFSWPFLQTLGSLSHADAQDLVYSLRDWRERCQARAAEGQDEGT